MTVTVNGGVPSRLAKGEVEGLGVDIDRGSNTKNGYQLFASGDSRGWFAYLDTPKGFVEYPGTFGLGGPTFVFEVPWPSLGGRLAGRFDAFIDWSGPGKVHRPFGEDAAPDQVTVPFRP